MQKTLSDNSTPSVDYFSNENDEKIDLGEILAVLTDHKWFIAFITGSLSDYRHHQSLY